MSSFSGGGPTDIRLLNNTPVGITTAGGTAALMVDIIDASGITVDVALVAGGTSLAGDNVQIFGTDSGTTNRAILTDSSGRLILAPTSTVNATFSGTQDVDIKTIGGS